MNNELITRYLIEHVHPAIQAQIGSSSSMQEPLRSMLLGAAHRMAEARGLDPGLLPEPDSQALAALQSIDFSHVDVSVLGDVYTALLSGRHQRGSYYTPHSLAESIARQVLSPDTPAQRILDPAVGSGHFLLAAADIIAGRDKQGDRPQARWSSLTYLYGVDNDPLAVEWAAVSLWLWAACPGTTPSMLQSRLFYGDALLDDHLWQGALAPPFDVIIGNPPYASAITRARTPDPFYRSALQSRYHTARGSFDLSVPFVERAVGLCKEGGWCGLVLPNKLLAADYARPLRSWLSEQVTLEAIMDASQKRPFAAHVYPIALILHNVSPSPRAKLDVYQWKASSPSMVRPEIEPQITQMAQIDGDDGPLAACSVSRRVELRTIQADLHTTPGGSWSCLLDPDWIILRRSCRHTVPLGEVARLVSGLTVGEAYSLRPFVFDAPGDELAEDTLRLLTSRLIRRFDSAWGQTPAPYLKTIYQRPAVALDVLPARRREQARSGKIIVAGMGRTPRAVVDRGQAQASVSTTLIIDTAWPLDALCALLNSQLVGRLCRAIFGGLALGGGHLRFGKPELSCLPLPAVDVHDSRLLQLDALSRQRASTVAHSLAVDIEEKIDALIYTLYGYQ